MLFQIKKIENQKLNILFEKAIDELQVFFGIKLIQKPNIFLLDNRLLIDSLKFKKTPDWLVGWTQNNNIYLLKQNAFSKESCQGEISDARYFALIKHEICHLFLNLFVSNSYQPLWLLEGICGYVSGQNKYKNKPQVFQSFLKSFQLSDLDNEVYKESGFAIEILILKYGKNKLLRLLTKNKRSQVKNKADFLEKFKKIYGFDLSYEVFNKK